MSSIITGASFLAMIFSVFAGSPGLVLIFAIISYFALVKTTY